MLATAVSLSWAKLVEQDSPLKRRLVTGSLLNNELVCEEDGLGTEIDKFSQERPLLTKGVIRRKEKDDEEEEDDEEDEEDDRGQQYDEMEEVEEDEGEEEMKNAENQREKETSDDNPHNLSTMSTGTNSKASSTVTKTLSFTESDRDRTTFTSVHSEENEHLMSETTLSTSTVRSTSRATQTYGSPSPTTPIASSVLSVAPSRSTGTVEAPISPKRSSLLTQQLNNAHQKTIEASHLSNVDGVQGKNDMWVSPKVGDAFLPESDISLVWTASDGQQPLLDLRLCILKNTEDMKSWQNGVDPSSSCGGSTRATVEKDTGTGGWEIVFKAPSVATADGFYVVMDFHNEGRGYGSRKRRDDLSLPSASEEQNRRILSPPFVLAPHGTDLSTISTSPSPSSTPLGASTSAAANQDIIASPLTKEAQHPRPVAWSYIFIPLAVVSAAVVICLLLVAHRSGRRGGRRKAMALSQEMRDDDEGRWREEQRHSHQDILSAPFGQSEKPLVLLTPMANSHGRGYRSVSLRRSKLRCSASGDHRTISASSSPRKIIPSWDGSETGACFTAETHFSQTTPLLRESKKASARTSSLVSRNSSTGRGSVFAYNHRCLPINHVKEESLPTIVPYLAKRDPYLDRPSHHDKPLPLPRVSGASLMEESADSIPTSLHPRSTSAALHNLGISVDTTGRIEPTSSIHNPFDSNQSSPAVNKEAHLTTSMSSTQHSLYPQMLERGRTLSHGAAEASLRTGRRGGPCGSPSEGCKQRADEANELYLRLKNALVGAASVTRMPLAPK